MSQLVVLTWIKKDEKINRIPERFWTGQLGQTQRLTDLALIWIVEGGPAAT